MNDYDFLFEQNFSFTDDHGSTILDFKKILLVVLNSKEFMNTELKISNKPVKSVLMGLLVTPKSKDSAYI